MNELEEFKTVLIKKFESKKKELIIAHREQRKSAIEKLIIEINAIASLINEPVIYENDISTSLNYYSNR